MVKKFNNFIVLFSIIILLAPTLKVNAVTEQVSLVTSTTYKIQKGEKFKLYVVGYKSSKISSWKSSNKKIATVSKKGVVTGKRGGTCKITATIGKKKYSAKVMVIAGQKVVYERDFSKNTKIKDRTSCSDIEITSINAENKALYEGQTFLLKIKGTNKKIKWKSTNEDVATVSAYGYVTAKSPGKAKIIGTFESGDYIYENSCVVTVTSAWMSIADIEYNYGTRFVFFGNSIYIIDKEANDILLDSSDFVTINDIPENMEIDKIYGTDVTYKYDGSIMLFNIVDLYNLGIV